MFHSRGCLEVEQGRRILKKIFIILCMLFLVAGLSNAQERGAIKGKVVDQDGVALPGVGVNLTGGKIAPRNTITSDQGNFRFLNLPVGSDYTLVIELAGFQTITHEELDVSFGRVIFAGGIFLFFSIVAYAILSGEGDA